METRDFHKGIAQKTQINNRALWDDIKKDYFVKLLCANANSLKKRGWNKEIWVKITEMMKEKFVESSFRTEQLKQLERDLKKSYKSIKSIIILQEPYFTWDHIDNMLKASDEDWQKLFMKDPKARKWHGKIIPYYSGLDTLFGGGDHDNGVQVAQSKQGTKLCLNSVPTETDEETGENFGSDGTFHDTDTINFSHGENVSMSRTQVYQSPKRPRQNDAIMNEQNKLPFPRNQLYSPRNCGFEKNPMITYPTNTMYKFTITECLREFHELMGFQHSDLLHVGEIFKNEQNREVFLALRKSERGIWLRASIDDRESNLFPK